MTRKLLKFNLRSTNTIDTTAIYQYDGEFSRDSNDKLYYARYGYENYYKFYGNGKVGYFGLQEKKNLSLEKMNPCHFLNAYYGVDNTGNYILKRFAKTKANGSYTIKCFLKFRGDTLQIIDEDQINTGYKKIFIKKSIPREWLIYKPDW
ncbi:MULTISPECIES: hypothetical protein [Chryseobacterium]|nr:MULTISPECIES: hypothetical protein [Chryseobacterium]QQV01952.1 hypothetical protein I6I61_12825 [Chryseobacterium sp. FDAARGOS 1104]